MDDLLDENNETVIVTLSNPVNATLGTNTVHTYTITDNDPTPTVTFTAASQSYSEAVPGEVDITVQLLAVSGLDVTIPFTVNASSTATGSLTDYGITESPVTLLHGNTTVTIPIIILPDGIVEGDETIIIDMGTPVNANLGTIISHTVTILDADSATLRITKKADAYENISDGVFRIVTDKQFDADVAVSFSVGGTATAGTDYTALTSPVTFPAYRDTLLVPVPQLDDSESEVSEYIIMNLTGTNNPRVSIAPAPDSTATVTLFDDDLPLVYLSQSDTTISEAGGKDILRASLNKVHHDDVIVTVGAKATGTATAGTDYTFAATITVPAGSLSAADTLRAVQDLMVESDESLTIEILSVTNGMESGIQEVSTRIIDDDTSVLTVEASRQSAEDGTDGQFTIRASKQFDKAVTVTFMIGGTATEGTDYIPLGTTVLFPDSTSSITLPVDVIADNLVEFGENVSLTLLSSTNPDVTVSGTSYTATVGIQDNDTSHLSLRKVRDGAEGGVAGGLFVISSDRQLGSPVEVHITLGGTATEGIDYRYIGQYLVFPAYTDSINVPVAITDDLLVEGKENIVMEVMGTDEGSVVPKAGRSRAGMEITDNDYARYYITKDRDASEPNLAATFIIGSDKPVEWDVPITLLRSGTATENTDFKNLDLPMIFPAHQTQLFIPVIPVDDDCVEGAETVTLKIDDMDNDNVLFRSDTIETMTIADNDTASFSIEAVQDAGEGSAAGLFAIRSTKLFPGQVPLMLITSGSAIPGVDYSWSGPLVAFPANSYTMTIPVPAIDDNLVEGTEVATLSLRLSGSTLPQVKIDPLKSTATVQVQDNDTARASVAAIRNVSENGAVGLFRFMLDHPVEGGVKLALTIGGTASEGEDYVAVPDSVQVPSDSLWAELAIVPVADSRNEGTENVMVSITGTSKRNVLPDYPKHHWASLQIVDDDTEPLVSVQPAGATEGDGNVPFRVTLSQPSGKTVKVSYATAETGEAITGEDFVATAGTLVFAPGDTVKTVGVPVIDDLLDEWEESFLFQLSRAENAALATDAVPGTIADNDPEPKLTLSFADGQVQENGATWLRTRLSNVSGKPVHAKLKISGTATSGQDYTLYHDSLTILPGMVADSIAITALPDTLVEGMEDLTAVITGAVNVRYNTDTVTLQIADMDQWIRFDGIASKTYGDPDFDLTATSTSGLAVEFTCSNTDVAVITGSRVKIKGAGKAIITARLPGNSLYDAAPAVSQELTVARATLQVKAEDATKVYGVAMPVLIITYRGFVNGEDANILDKKPEITTVATRESDAGSYPLAIGGGSDSNYGFEYTNGVLTISKAPQSITFGELDNAKVGDSITLGATATSGLEITYSSSDPTIATIRGNKAILHKEGTVQIIASQGGNKNYLPAESVTRKLVVIRSVLAEWLKIDGPLCYPNPFEGEIILNEACKDARSVTLYDINGRKVNAEVMGNRIDCGMLRKGTYLLEVDLGQGYILRKQVVKK